MDVKERFLEIYEETYKMTASAVISKCRQVADSGDIIQEVYLELYRILQKRGIGYIKDPRAFLRKITKQKLFAYYRGLDRQRTVFEEPTEDGLYVDTADIESLSVEELVTDKTVLDWTDQFLRSKGEITRKIFHLYYRLGLSIPEIAEALTRTESDVKNKLYRTLKEIREYWKGEN